MNNHFPKRADPVNVRSCAPVEMLSAYFWRTLVMCDFKNKLFSVNLNLLAGFEACLSGGDKSEGTFWLMDNQSMAEVI